MATKIVYSIWSEWDIGLESFVFSSRELARTRAEEAYKAAMGDSPYEESFDDLWCDLIGIDEMELVSE